MPSSGGHTVSVVAACGWWGKFSHSTPKEVFVSAGQNYHHEISACWRLLREKQRRKESSLKAERRGENIAECLVMFTAPSNVQWLVGKPSNYSCKDGFVVFLYFSHHILSQPHQKSVKGLPCYSNEGASYRYFYFTSVDLKPRPRDLFHSGSWSHLPLTITV